MSTVQINALAGIRNDVSTERFAPGDLLVGKNIDIDETGKVFRRRGFQNVNPNAAHSAFSDGETMLYVTGNNLTRRLDDGTDAVLKNGIASPVAYSSVNGSIYLSDGKQSLVVENNGSAARQWGLEVPAKTMYLTAVSGQMKAGVYGVTIVYLRRGMESGAPRSQYIALRDNEGIHIDDIPIPSDPLIDGKRLYITAPDGEDHYAADFLDPGEDTALITALTDQITVLRTQHKTPAPAGHIVSFFSGSMFVAVGSDLFWSEPNEFELFDLRSNFVRFDSRIQIFAPVVEGVFIATEHETVFLRGRNPEEWEVVKAAPYGAVCGTLVTPPNHLIGKSGTPGAVALWMSKKGVCVGTSDGQLQNLTGDRFVMPAARTGAGLFKMRGGTPQYLVSLYS